MVRWHVGEDEEIALAVSLFMYLYLRNTKLILDRYMYTGFTSCNTFSSIFSLFSSFSRVETCPITFL